MPQVKSTLLRLFENKYAFMFFGDYKEVVELRVKGYFGFVILDFVNFLNLKSEITNPKATFLLTLNV